MSEFAHKVVLITGASSGIGAEMARQFVDRGAKVGMLARRSELLERVAADIDGGSNVAWEVADVGDVVALHAALDRLAAQLGAPDIVVANAGYGHPEPPDDHVPGAAEQMYDTNLFGMLRLIDWVLPQFVERGSGQIVGVASVAGYLGMPYSASYSGSKAAMRVHLQSLRVQLKPKGITVTTISPGFVESPMTDDADFPTPFKLSTDDAVGRMLDAIERGKGEFAFPLPTRLGIGAMSRLLPASLVERLLRFVS